MVTYFITYDVTDAAGNKAVQLLRKITVEAADTPDITAPVITLKGESETIVAQGSSYTDPGINATDDRDGDLTDKVVVAGDQVDTFVPGVYNITYNLTDAAGNQAEEVVRKVTVQAADILPPLLSLKGQAVVYITQETSTQMLVLPPWTSVTVTYHLASLLLERILMLMYPMNTS